MDRRRIARTVLAADGVGCLVTAVAVLNRRVGDRVHPAPEWRTPVAAALGLTGASLMRGAVRSSPTDGDLVRAAVTNGVWVAACSAALTRDLPRSGVGLVGTTAVLDAAMAGAQWALRSR